MIGHSVYDIECWCDQRRCPSHLGLLPIFSLPPSGAGAVAAQSVPGWWPGQTAASAHQTSHLWSSLDITPAQDLGTSMDLGYQLDKGDLGENSVSKCYCRSLVST